MPPPPVGAAQVVLSEQADAALRTLRRSTSPEAAAIDRRVRYLGERLRLDCQEGEVIPCPLRGRSRGLEERHGGLDNLYCCDLPGFWRLLYTIDRSSGERVVVVLEIVPHREYDKWF